MEHNNLIEAFTSSLRHTDYQSPSQEKRKLEAGLSPFAINPIKPLQKMMLLL